MSNFLPHLSPVLSCPFFFVLREQDLGIFLLPDDWLEPPVGSAAKVANIHVMAWFATQYSSHMGTW